MLSFLSWCTCKITVLFLRTKRFIDRPVGAYFLAHPVDHNKITAASYCPCQHTLKSWRLKRKCDIAKYSTIEIAKVENATLKNANKNILHP